MRNMMKKYFVSKLQYKKIILRKTMQVMKNNFVDIVEILTLEQRKNFCRGNCNLEYKKSVFYRKKRLQHRISSETKLIKTTWNILN